MIVIGYTADEFGEAALDHGLAAAQVRNTSVRVVNATAGDAYTDPAFASTDQVRSLEARLAGAGVSFEIAQPVGVDPAAELLDAMDDPEAEMLVIGVRYRNPVGKLLLGSTAQRLLLECRKPVLAVKPAE